MDAKRYIWADAICIYQLDLVEKARHISNLFRIFKRASEVIVWLGKEGVLTKDAFAIFRDAWRQYKQQVYQQRWVSLPDGESDDRLSAVDIIRENGDLTDLFATGMADLFQRTLFCRAWCVQEVFAARTIS